MITFALRAGRCAGLSCVALLAASAAHAQVDCWQACPPNSLAPFEPCEMQTDDGCDDLPVLFHPIPLGSTVCAQMGLTGADDADWYLFTLTQYTHLCVFTASESSVIVDLANLDFGCAGVSFFDDQLTVEGCGWGALHACVGAGSWAVRVRPAFSGGASCDDADYHLTLYSDAVGDHSAAPSTVAALQEHTATVRDNLEQAVASVEDEDALLSQAMNAAANASQHAANALNLSAACGPAAQPAQGHIADGIAAIGAALDLAGDMENQNGLRGSEGLGGKIQMDEAQAILDQIQIQLRNDELWRPAMKALDVKALHDRCDDKLDHAKELGERYDEKRAASKANFVEALGDMQQAMSSLSQLGPCANGAMQATNSAINALQQALAALNNEAPATAVVASFRAANEAFAQASGQLSHLLGILRGCVCPECPPCIADFNHDTIVDGADLGILLGAWNSNECDLNGDSIADGGDLGILLGAWGPCS